MDPPPLSATPSPSDWLTYTPTPGFLGVGGYNYTVSDGALTGTGHVTVNVTTPKTAQTITVQTHAPPNAYQGDTFNVLATASSGLAVVYSSGNPSVCTNSGATFTMVSGNGTCPVRFDQPGNASYYAAPQIVENVVGISTHSIDLVEGWNLVSFNLIPLSTNIEDVLDEIGGLYDLVYAWDASGASSGSGNWLVYDPNVGMQQSLSTLTNQMGFWINMNDSGTLEVTGTSPSATAVSLQTGAGGWNLVGYPSGGSEALPGALTDHGVGSSSYTVIYAYHAADVADVWKEYHPLVPPYANDLTTMTPGWGYWIYVHGASTWNVGY